MKFFSLILTTILLAVLGVSFEMPTVKAGLGGSGAVSITAQVVVPGQPSGGGAVVPVQTTVHLIGRTFPEGEVTLLQEGFIKDTVFADGNGHFQFSLIGVKPGNHNFSLYAHDDLGRRTNMMNFPVTATFEAITYVTGIFLSPTIEINKKGTEAVVLNGRAVPGAEVFVLINGPQNFSFQTIADQDGFYEYGFSVNEFVPGDYWINTQAFFNGIYSDISVGQPFAVAQLDDEVELEVPDHFDEESFRRVDLNNDGRVDLIDFSILIYWFERPNPPTQVDLNNDGRVDLIDFSILAYYWTG